MIENLSAIINEVGEEREKYFNAVAPPIIQTSNFSFKNIHALRALTADESKGALYTRGRNPTVEILAKKIAALDGSEEALIFGSGVAAITTPILSLLKQGDHVVSVRNVYSWTYKLFTDVLPKFGIQCTFVDGADTENFFKAVLPNTRLIYLESPNTFTFELQDVETICRYAKSKSIITMIDNSYSSPLLMRPISLGVDLCVQSASKYLGGHSDIVAGVLSGSSALLNPIYKTMFLNLGGIISPMNAWLMIRALRTIELRIDRVCSSTKKVVDFLSSHPKVEKVIWPFHPSHPQYELAKKQMKAGAGLFAVVLKSKKLADIETFCNSLRHFLIAVSWGGHESLVIPVCGTIAAAQFDPSIERHRNIRLYVGLEDSSSLIADIDQALGKCGN